MSGKHGRRSDESPSCMFGTLEVGRQLARGMIEKTEAAIQAKLIEAFPQVGRHGDFKPLISWHKISFADRGSGALCCSYGGRIRDWNAVPDALPVPQRADPPPCRRSRGCFHRSWRHLTGVSGPGVSVRSGQACLNCGLRRPPTAIPSVGRGDAERPWRPMPPSRATDHDMAFPAVDVLDVVAAPLLATRGGVHRLAVDAGGGAGDVRNEGYLRGVRDAPYRVTP